MPDRAPTFQSEFETFTHPDTRQCRRHENNAPLMKLVKEIVDISPLPAADVEEGSERVKHKRHPCVDYQVQIVQEKAIGNRDYPKTQMKMFNGSMVCRLFHGMPSSLEPLSRPQNLMGSETRTHLSSILLCIFSDSPEEKQAPKRMEY